MAAIEFFPSHSAFAHVCSSFLAEISTLNSATIILDLNRLLKSTDHGITGGMTAAIYPRQKPR